MLVLIFIICGFIYGSDYFKICETYGNNITPIGIYILAIRWWNVKVNWYTRLDNWYICFSIVLKQSIKEKRYKEYSVIFSDTGIKTCVLNIN